MAFREWRLKKYFESTKKWNASKTSWKSEELFKYLPKSLSKRLDEEDPLNFSTPPRLYGR